ncbi:MAG: N-acetylmuramoyl-L-alanine amidase [Bacilli bacterium]
MKKIIITFILLLIITLLGYFTYVNYIKDKISKIKPEDEVVDITEYYIYGNHLNIKGNIKLSNKNYQSIVLNMHGIEDKDIELKIEEESSKINFYVSETLNEGIYLDDLPRGIYYLFLKITYENSENPEKELVKYYTLKNNTDYKETSYYTLSKYNNKIIINSDNEYNTMALNIKENKDSKEIADITLDPGHGGMDGGGTANNYKETDFTLDICEKIKDNLEKSGLKVKLTHKKEDLSSGEVLDEYNTNGRAVIPNEVMSKYTFSIHINTNNSSSVNGLEIYTASDINYDLAKSLADSITSYTGINYSTNKLYKMYDGVYTHNFTESEVTSALEKYKQKNYKPYNVTTKSNFLYMIRETGGFMTGAYIDDSNPEKVGVNPYYNSNIGNESYLLEIAYLSNKNDLNILIDKQDKFAEAIADSIKKELGI